MTPTDEFKCLECGGDGTLDCGMGPTPITVQCDDCRGTGYVDAEVYLEQCMAQIFLCRQQFHMRWKANRIWAWKAHEDACRWLAEAKKARAIVLEREHAGAKHLGRAA